jgi:nondiscriminating aspartyl-tRNA synthetase
VYEEAPVFRAEEHNTSRHLNEYISLDFEMALENGFEDIIQVETAVLNSIFAKLKETCQPEIAQLGIEIPEIKKIVTVKFGEVHEIVLKETGKDFRDQNDLDPEEERLICDYSKKHWDSDFVFVTHYPASKRPFYALNDPENPEETCSFDLLFRGIEITTGGARMHLYSDYVKKMEGRGMNVASFESFLQIFRYGMPPHGGLGLGLERLTAQLCGLANVKEASLFPRDMHRLEP